LRNSKPCDGCGEKKKKKREARLSATALKNERRQRKPEHHYRDGSNLVIKREGKDGEKVINQSNVCWQFGRRKRGGGGKVVNSFYLEAA